MGLHMNYSTSNCEHVWTQAALFAIICNYLKNVTCTVLIGIRDILHELRFYPLYLCKIRQSTAMFMNFSTFSCLSLGWFMMKQNRFR